jgi:hypothetical protein
MHLLCWLIFVTGAYPLWCAWHANRRTSLSHALAWAGAAWLAWGASLATADLGTASAVGGMRYLALCLTGCAEVAVLGARRPGVAAWNFVVGGLLVVLLLSLAEGILVGGTLQLGGVRVVFLAGTLLVGIVNYLPTRLAAASLVLAAGCALTIGGLIGEEGTATSVGDCVILLVPWAAWLATRRPAALSSLDRLWREFRDRFGLVWGQRLREQFNRSAFHAGWRVELAWQGLRPSAGAAPPDAATEAACLAALHALLKRFGMGEQG